MMRITTQRSDYSSSSSSSCDALECCNNWNRCIPGRRCNCLPCMFRYYANYRYMSTLSSVYSRSSTGAASRVCCCCKFLSRFLHNATTTATHAQLAAMRKYCALIDIDKYSFWANTGLICLDLRANECDENYEWMERIVYRVNNI